MTDTPRETSDEASERIAKKVFVITTLGAVAFVGAVFFFVL
jgi:hypothetical protein